MSKGVTWVNRLTLQYAGKTEEKTVEIPGSPEHRRLQKHVDVATGLLKNGDYDSYNQKPKKRNYLAARITFVISDKGQEPHGDHGRTYLPFDFKVPQKGLFNSTGLRFPEGMDVFQATGHHTEQVLYTYLKTTTGQERLLQRFKEAEALAVQGGKIAPLADGAQRKVYAMVLDMHSSLNMCTLNSKMGGMDKSCSTATLQEQMPGKENLRAITARTFHKAGYVVSGYNREALTTKEGKIGLKMATRVSCQEVDNRDRGALVTLEDTAINHYKNELILHKQVPSLEELLTLEDYKQTGLTSTIFKSSTQTGLVEVFNKHFADVNGKTGKPNRAAIRNLMLTFPHEMENAGLMDKVIGNARLVKSFPNILSDTVELLDSKKLRDALLDAFVTGDNYDKAIDCYGKGATLTEKHYGARNKNGNALICHPNEEGHTILWGVTESGSKQTFDTMVNAAKLSEKEIKEATRYDEVDEINAIFQKMELKDSGRLK